MKLLRLLMLVASAAVLSVTVLQLSAEGAAAAYVETDCTNDPVCQRIDELCPGSTTKEKTYCNAFGQSTCTAAYCNKADLE